FAARAGADEVDDEADSDEDGGVAYLVQKILARDKHVDEACERDERGDWVEPHAERARQVGAAYAQDDDADDLREELHEYAYDDERRDHVGEPEEAEERRDAAHHQERDVREAMAGVHAREDA